MASQTSADTRRIISQRVLRGTLLLDKHLPGWASSIDLKTFAISDVRACVLGQLFGTYGLGLSSLVREIEVKVAPTEFAIEHGFTHPCPSTSNWREEWDILNSVWFHVIWLRQWPADAELHHG